MLLLPGISVPGPLSRNRHSPGTESPGDLMRDREDQVRKQLKQLEVRIAERKDERDLDRRVNQFLGEESFFDDSDRRLRVRREVTTLAADAKAEGGDAKKPEPSKAEGKK